MQTEVELLLLVVACPAEEHFLKSRNKKLFLKTKICDKLILFLFF